MTTAHTAGPWFALPYGQTFDIVGQRGDVVIDGGVRSAEGIKQGDALLIAAAPELLQMLQAMVAACQGDLATLEHWREDDASTTTETLDAILRRARGVIAKAEGKAA